MTEQPREGSFEHKSLQDETSIVDYLEALQRGFDGGRLLLCAGKEELILSPRGLFKFSLKAKRKDGEARVRLEIAWKEPKEKQTRRAPLEISVPAESDG